MNVCVLRMEENFVCVCVLDPKTRAVSRIKLDFFTSYWPCLSVCICFPLCLQVV